MKIIAELLGGSHLYGLNTPASDEDLRFVYLHENIADIIGLNKNDDFVDTREFGEDTFGQELRHFITSLRKTNTQGMEVLFADDEDFTILEPEFKLVRKLSHNLIDPDKYYKSLKGYIFSERRLANGERTGKLGGKRKAALEKHGFSPKNYVQLMRLAKCGAHFFEFGEYPVKISKYYPEEAELLMSIKLHPEKHDKKALEARSYELETLLDKAYQHKKIGFVFDEYAANRLIFDTYYPILKAINEK
jgi:hypothetical protein